MEQTSGTNDDDLELPFIFVPHGQPEPLDWMARHPGYLRLPATMVPKQQIKRLHTPAIPVMAATAAAPAATSGLMETLGIGGRVVLSDALTAIEGPLAVLGFLLHSTRTAGPEIDEARPELNRSLHEQQQGLVPPPPIAPPPGFIPPSDQLAKPGEGGFAPSPPSPPLPGFVPATPQPNMLPGAAPEENTPLILQQQRNEGLEGGLRTRSERAREAARQADPQVIQSLENTDWKAHHLINMAAIRGAAKLLAAAAKAGWKTDDLGNVAPLPANQEAQRKLAEEGIERPLHDNGHPNWNEEVLQSLNDIEDKLAGENLGQGSDSYAKRAREELEKLQIDLRQKLFDLNRLTE